MKTVQVDEKRLHKNTTGYESESMGIADDALAHVIGVLTKLYSQPAWAVLREVVSNGLDAHSNDGIIEPVEITLPDPSKKNSFLIVRDQGRGMTKDEISKIYKLYGASTKRADNRARGGFGLGAKSPLAITDKFEVTSISRGETIVDQNGNAVQESNMLTEFYIEKDSQGLGQVYYTKHEATNLPSGVEVRIPYGSYANEIADINVVSKFFIGLPPNSIMISGQAPSVSLHNKDEYIFMGDLHGHLPTWTSINELATNGWDNLHVLIGGIHYSIDPDWLKLSSGAFLYSFLRHVYLTVPIGVVDLTPSRENLIYSERTTQALNTILTEYKQLAETNYKAELNRQATRKEAVEAFLKLASIGVWNQTDLQWHGEDVEVDLIPERGTLIMSAPGGLIHDKKKSKTSSVGIIFKQDQPIKRNTHFGDDVHGVLFVKGLPYQHGTPLPTRYMKAAEQAFGFHTVIVLTEKDYNNTWFEFLHHEDFDTLTKFLDAVKLWQRQERARLKAAGLATTATKAIGFFWRVEKTGAYTVERIYGDDEEFAELIKKPFYYISQSHNSREFPYMPMNLSTGEDLYEMKQERNHHYQLNEFIRPVTKGKPIVLITNRQRVDMFLGQYPNARPLITAVKNYAKTKFVPVRTRNWDTITQALKNYRVRERANSLIVLYERLAKENRLSEILIEEFHALKQYADLRALEESKREQAKAKDYKKTPEEVEAEAWQDALIYWSGYSKSEDTELHNLVESDARVIISLLNHFPLINIANSIYITDDMLDHAIHYINSTPIMPKVSPIAWEIASKP